MAKRARCEGEKEAAAEDKEADVPAVAAEPETAPPSAQSAACAAEELPISTPERRAAAGTTDIRMAPHGFLVGEEVVIHGLQQHTEHNGRRAVVLTDDFLEESQRGRVPILAHDHTPVFGKHSPAVQVALWPSNLRRADADGKKTEEATSSGKWVAPREKFKKRGR